MAVWRYVGYAAQCVIALTCVIGFDSAAPVPIYLFIYIIYIYINIRLIQFFHAFAPHIVLFPTV